MTIIESYLDSDILRQIWSSWAFFGCNFWILTSACVRRICYRLNRGPALPNKPWKLNEQAIHSLAIQKYGEICLVMSSISMYFGHIRPFWINSDPAKQSPAVGRNTDAKQFVQWHTVAYLHHDLALVQGLPIQKQHQNACFMRLYHVVKWNFQNLCQYLSINPATWGISVSSHLTPIYCGIWDVIQRWGTSQSKTLPIPASCGIKLLKFIKGY